MKKLVLLSFSIILYSATFAQVIPDKDQWTCNGVHENLYAQLNAGKTVVIAMQGLDCTGCIGNAPYVDTFATNNKADVRVWSALQLMAGSGGTCTQVDTWMQTHGYADVFAFLDSSNYWITNNPGAEWLVIDPADKMIKYKGYDRNQAFVEARKIFDPVSVKEVESTAVIKLYPNPAHDVISVQIQDNAMLHIYSADGRLVLSKSILTGYNDVDISQLSSGVYAVNILTEKQLMQTTIVKQ